MKTRELVRARAALADGELASALADLREARRVAVAQRKLDELLEVRELVASLSSRTSGSLQAASEDLARQVAHALRGFPADVLASVGIEPEPDVLVRLLARWRQHSRAGDRVRARTPELAHARRALDEGQPAAALSDLREARRVAVAQRKLEDLLEVYELARIIAERSSGRVRMASEGLTRKVEADLRTFAEAADA